MSQSSRIFKDLYDSRYCCNPFGTHKKKIAKGLRFVTTNLVKYNPSFNLTTKRKVCATCRNKLAKTPSPKSPECQSSSTSKNSSPSKSDVECSTPEEIENEYEFRRLNKSLASFDVTPLKKSRMSHSPHYRKAQFNKIGTTIKRKLELVSGEPMSSENEKDDNKTECEIIQQLKEKFNEATSRSEKLTVLTILPKSWTRMKIMDTFKCSQYMARQAKSLVKERGVLSTPNPHLGKRLPNETTDMVTQFYYSSEISRQMPGMKDYVSVKKADGCRERKQKFLVLCNLKEAFQKFKEDHPTVKIGFSKFADLRPKECVLAGASGTHSVCVCTKHQNVKLMMGAIKTVFKHDVTAFHNDEPGPSTSTWDGGRDTNYICHYRHCLALLLCNPPQEKCFITGQCDQCPRKEEFTDLLTEVFDRKGLDEVEFRQWIATDRSTLESRKLAGEEFIQDFYEQLQLLAQHDFIAKQQTAFMRQMKEELGEGMFLVVGDFAENYSFITQDAAQSFHWNNSQATLHPFVCYYRENNVLMHKSFVAISDCNQHDVIAVHLFQSRLINFLKLSHQVRKIFYFSDGCAAQYKNRKNFANLSHHKEDFDVDAEWHFFATSHGKGPCDGVGGSVKRLAARASIQRTGGSAEPILTPLALYNFAVTALPSVTFTFTTSEEHEAHKLMLEKRFENARTIPGKASYQVIYNYP